MNRNKRIKFAYCILIISVMLIVPVGLFYNHYYANIVYENETGRVEFADDGFCIEVSGSINRVFPMYEKNGNFYGAIDGESLAWEYKTADVDAAAEKYAKKHGLIYVPNGTADISAYIASKVGNTESKARQDAKTNEVSETQSDEKTTKKDSEKNTYKHGLYDNINTDAIKAFEYFTQDGTAESCYITIDINAEQRTMPGTAISLTKANREYGEVQFVDADGNIQYKFVFPEVSTDADFTMELTPEITENEVGINVDFKDEKLYNTDLGFEVDFFFQTGKPSTKLYVYTSEAGDYYEYNVITTNEEGFARLPYTVVQDYTFSEVDLKAAAEEAKAKEQAEAEAKRLEEEQKAVEEAAIQEATVEEPVSQETIIEDEARDEISNEKGGNTLIYILCAGVGLVVILGAFAFFRKWSRK